jgi:hypothetical protein
MDFSASAATKDAARTWRRRSCTPPRSSSTLPVSIRGPEVASTDLPAGARACQTF